MAKISLEVMNKIRKFLIAFLFVTSLFFTKHTTKDPYLIQDILFYYSLFFIYLLSFFIFIFNKEKKEQIFLSNFTKIEKNLFLFFSVCFFSFFLALLKNKSFRLAIFLQGDFHISWLITRSILIFFLPFMIPDKKFWINIFKVIIITTFLASIYGILQIFNIELFWNINVKKFGNRIISTFGNPNFLSSYLVMTIPPCFYFYKKSKKFIYLFILLILIFALILTYTRSSWLGIISAVIYFVIFYFKYFIKQEFQNKNSQNIQSIQKANDLKNTKNLQNFQNKECRDFNYNFKNYKNFQSFQKIQDINNIQNCKKFKNHKDYHNKKFFYIFKYLFLLFVFIISITLFSKDFRFRIKESFKLSKNNKSIYQRLIIYKTGLDIFKDNIIFGSGYGTFDIKAPFYIGKYIDNIDMYEHKTHANLAHNLVIQVLSEIGILGLIIFLSFWFLFFKISFLSIKNSQNNDEKLLILLLSSSIFGMIIDNFLNVTTQIPVTMSLFYLEISMIIKIYKDNLISSDKKTLKNEKKYIYSQNIFFITSVIILFIILIRNTKIFIAEKIFFNSLILTCDKDLKSLSPLTLLKSKKYILKSNKYFLYRTTKLYELARINQKLGLLDESIDAIKKAIKTHPGYSEFYLTNSVNYFKKNMFLEAKKNLEMAEKIDPLNINTLFLKYIIFKNEKNYTKSIKILEKATIIDGNNPYIYNNLGVCYSYLNDFKKAKDFFLLANKFGPQIPLISENIKKAENMQVGTFSNFELA